MSKFHPEPTKYDVGDYIVDFHESETSASLLDVDVIIKKKGSNEPYAVYKKLFNKTPNSKYYAAFEAKFLKNPSYRKLYFVEGENWEGIFDMEEYLKDTIHPRCKKAIEEIMKKTSNQLRFSDFAELKVGGLDKFSKMKDDELRAILPPEGVKIIGEEFDEKRSYTSALKWYARGLSPEYAIRKVKTDLEVQENAMAAKEERNNGSANHTQKPVTKNETGNRDTKTEFAEIISKGDGNAPF